MIAFLTGKAAAQVLRWNVVFNTDVALSICYSGRASFLPGSAYCIALHQKVKPHPYQLILSATLLQHIHPDEMKGSILPDSWLF